MRNGQTKYSHPNRIRDIASVLRVPWKWLAGTTDTINGMIVADYNEFVWFGFHEAVLPAVSRQRTRRMILFSELQRLISADFWAIRLMTGLPDDFATRRPLDKRGQDEATTHLSKAFQLLLAPWLSGASGVEFNERRLSKMLELSPVTKLVNEVETPELPFL